MNDDKRAIDELTVKLFDAINFEKGSSPNIFQIKNLFISEGLLIDKNSNGGVYSVVNFVSFFEEQNRLGNLQSLYETEIKSETGIYGKIAHRISYYEARFDQTDELPFSSGVNSIQFVKIDNEWKISSMAWNEFLKQDQ